MKGFGYFQYWAVRTGLIGIFLSYYIMMVAVNADRIEERFDPLRMFKGDVRALGGGIYVGPYAGAEELARLKARYGIRRVVSLLNPHRPLVRELVRHEKEVCAREGIEYVNIPEAGMPSEAAWAAVVSQVLASGNGPAYVHAYFAGDGMRRFAEELQAAR